MADDAVPDLCVVVGATGAFGRAVTERLVKRGQRVLGVGRHEADLAALAAEVPGVTPCVADIADDSAIEAIGGSPRRAGADGGVRGRAADRRLGRDRRARRTWPGARTSSSAACCGWSAPSTRGWCRAPGS